jgi:hypothetical protein
MGKFVPLIGTLTGKVGAMVIDKTGRTRLHAPGPNRTPIGVKNAFSVMAKSWPFSSTEYKSLVSDAPGVARGIGYLTGRAYRAYELAPVVVEGIDVDAKGIVPYRLSNLPGEFGEGIQLFPFTVVAACGAGGVTVTVSFTTLPTVKAGTWEMALLIVSNTGLVAGTIDSGLAGAVVVDGTPGGSDVVGVDTRLTTAGTEGFYSLFGAIIAADSETSLPICLGFFSGCVENAGT